MQVKVLRSFRDKYSGEIRKEGTTITVSKDRYAEILKKGPLVERVKATKKPRESTE
jgi:hypothetical protein